MIRILRAMTLVTIGLVLSGPACATSDAPPITPKDSGRDTTADTASETKADTGPTPDTAPGDTKPADTTTEAGDGGCSPPPGCVCSLFPQCGCASGENCVVTSFTAAGYKDKCIKAGATLTNERCAYHADCGVGNACIGKLCRPYCKLDADCTFGAEAECITVKGSDSSGGSFDIPGYMVCFTGCDPMAPSGACPPTTGCSFATGLGKTIETTCVAAGTGGDGTDCTSDSAVCGPGFTCVKFGTSTTSVCAKWCRTTSSSDCPSPKTCGKFSPPAPTYKGTEYGVCATPP